MSAQRPRFGASLVEVLVAVAVVAVLTGLLLSVVQKVRERATAARVQNSLRQVAMAATSYATAHGGQLPNVDGGSPHHGMAPLIALGPELGQSAEAVRQWVAAPLLRVRGADPTVSGAPTPAFVTYDKLEEAQPLTSVSVALNPHLFAAKARVDRSVPDGLSNTVAAVTHYANCRQTMFLPGTGGTSGGADENGKPVPVSNPRIHRATFADPQADDVKPVTSVETGQPVTTGSQPRTFQHRPVVADCDYRVPQSLTAGGLTIGFADGSVRTLRPQVAPAVFWGAVTPAGGEVLAWGD